MQIVIIRQRCAQNYESFLKTVNPAMCSSIKQCNKENIPATEKISKSPRNAYTMLKLTR